MTRRLLFASLAALPLAGLTVLALTCERRPDVGPLDTPERLRAALAKRGLVYEAREFVRGDVRHEPGLYLRRPGDARPWGELAGQEHAPRPERWRGYVRVTALRPGQEPHEGPNRRCLGTLLLVGDPVELDAIAAALR